MKPIIAITCGLNSESKGFYRIAATYEKAIAKNGGIPLYVTSATNIEAIIKTSQGILLTGGGDCSGFLFGEETSPLANPPDEARDRWEYALIQKAHEMGTPLMGICRGMQMINIALGGTIWQDLSLIGKETLKHKTKSPTKEPVHTVSITKNSFLRHILQKDTLAVNSCHHQAVKDTAPTLKVSALADDGIIEAIEGENIRGYQWHPEHMTDSVFHFALFQEFVSLTNAK